MKWEGYNETAARRVTSVVTKITKSRGFYTLVALASLALILAASLKWTG